MPIVKTFSVGDGDTYYINHGSDNFSIIDCNLNDDRKEEIVDEIILESEGKVIKRFISTHPDDDHICGIEYLDNQMPIINFYCVKNSTTKNVETASFKHYKKLRDDKGKAFNLYKDCTRRWMNRTGDGIKSAGINILWPDTENKHYKDALENAADGESPNNISIVAHYKTKGSASFCWFGDLETKFMKKITNDISLRESTIIFAPHHGRKSGRLPKPWLDDLQPKIIVVGDAPSENLEYYQDYNTIKQNSAGDVTFECDDDKVHIYCSKDNYEENFLYDDDQADNYGNYLGTLDV